MIVRYVPLKWIQMRLRIAGKRITDAIFTGMVKHGLFDMEKLGNFSDSAEAYNQFVQRHLQGHIYSKFWESCIRENPTARKSIKRQQQKYMEDFEMSSSDNSASSAPTHPRQRSRRRNSASSAPIDRKQGLIPRNSASGTHKSRSRSSSSSSSSSNSSSSNNSSSPTRQRSRSSSPSRGPNVAVRTSRRLLFNSKIGPFNSRFVKKAGPRKSVIFIEPTNRNDKDKNLPGNICRGIRRVCRYKDKNTKKKYINFIDDGSENDEYVMTIGYT
ncbi:hypothetical protein TNIN_164361 [Trichonephila inaurata madagascariensis]|uniref:Uncharacterized protein n=1 Tax=Trichonephila inaurata madagascariensis TaxID=2747483 RepID=A0A8X7BQD9_9ARAC|nr:hypothetical protein TNIN_164361 [Trichonephila inaurata madagascariensis]